MSEDCPCSECFPCPPPPTLQLFQDAVVRIIGHSNYLLSTYCVPGLPSGNFLATLEGMTSFHR